MTDAFDKPGPEVNPPSGDEPPTAVDQPATSSPPPTFESPATAPSRGRAATLQQVPSPAYTASGEARRPQDHSSSAGSTGAGAGKPSSALVLVAAGAGFLALMVAYVQAYYQRMETGRAAGYMLASVAVPLVVAGVVCLLSKPRGISRAALWTFVAVGVFSAWAAVQTPV